MHQDVVMNWRTPTRLTVAVVLMLVPLGVVLGLLLALLPPISAPP